MSWLGTGIEIGSIYAKVGADLSDFDRGMAEAATTMKATAATMKTSGNGMAADTERVAKKMKKAWYDSERGLINFDRTAKKVRSTLSGGPFGLLGAFGKLISLGPEVGRMTQYLTKDFADMLNRILPTNAATLALSGPLSALPAILGAVSSGVVGAALALAVLPAIAAAATFVFVALLDVVTTLAAALAALVAPLSLVVGLLGLLGAGFFLAFKTAMKGNGIFGPFADKLGRLGGQFAGLTRQLGKDFLPIFWKIAGVAQIALNYFDKLSHMSLADAFKSLSTTGVKKLNDLIYGIGHLLAKPFRLAISLAFGGTGGGMASAVSKWWGSFTKYLFGYVKTKRIMLSPGKFGFETKNIKGALDPIVKWFNKQNFTATGLKWADDIISGLSHSKALTDSLKDIVGHAASWAGRAFVAAFMGEIKGLLSRLGAWFNGPFTTDVNNWIGAAFKDVGHLIAAPFIAAWNAVKAKAIQAWNGITRRISSDIDNLMSEIRGVGGAFASWAGSIAGAIPGLTTILDTVSKISGLIGGGGGTADMSHGAGGGHGGRGPASHHAAGTPYTDRGAFLAGEHGPELVRTGRGARVDPHWRTKKLLGDGHGRTVHVHNPVFLSGDRNAAEAFARWLRPLLDGQTARMGYS